MALTRSITPFSWVLVTLFSFLLVPACSEPRSTNSSATLTKPLPAVKPADDSADSVEKSGEVADTGAGGEPAEAEAEEPQPDAAAGTDQAEEPAEQEVVAPAEQSPKTVLILGDSLAATGFGVMLEKRLDAHPLVTCFRKGKSASGLARPDFFDWPGEAKRQLERRKPDLVVVIMGGNDGQDLISTKKGTRRIGWKSESWDAGYRERMDAFLATLSQQDRTVLWLGLPKTNTVKFEAKLRLIRSIQEAALTQLGEQHRYLNTTPLLSDEEGTLLRMIKVGRKTHALRAEDGIHFTMSGSTYFADKVLPEVLKSLNLDPVEDK